MFPKNYDLGLVISAVITLAVILLVVRIYLVIVNKRSNIIKPDWINNDKISKSKQKD